MKIMRLKTCCCVFSLRTGSLVLLWINLIASLIVILLPLNLSLVGESSHSANNSEVIIAPYSGQIYKKTTTTAAPQTDLRKLSDEFSINYRAVEAIKMWSPPAAWIIAVTSVSAIYGVSKAKPMFILPFILSSLLIAILLAVVEVAVTSRQFIFCSVAYLIIHSEIFLYFLLVIYSYYRDISGYTDDV